MPRLSWSLAAALSMSAIAVFRPEIGSKSLAAHAARSLTRVVASLSQRLHAGNVRVASAARDERLPTPIEANVAEVSSRGALSGSQTGDQSGHAPASTRSVTKTVYTANSAFTNDSPSSSRVGDGNAPPTKYSGQFSVSLALVDGVGSDMTSARERSGTDISPQTNERQWKDCAVAAICSGIPGPATLHSTPLALGKPPSV
jgi:hypothetical protein